MNRAFFVKIITIFLMSLGGIGIVGGGFLISRTFNRQEESSIVSNISDYKKIRNQIWLNPKEISHFPPEIPADAQVKGFIYSPASATGGSALQLRLQKSPSQVRELLSHYRQIAQAKYYGGHTNEHLNRDTPLVLSFADRVATPLEYRGLPTTFFYTGNHEGDNAFPASYEILVLGAKDEGITGFPWSHGHSYGVAINTQAAEIVYWAEVW